MMRAPRYYLQSYGCQMNKLDSELVESRLVAAGYESCASEQDADVVLLNTCAVRQHAEDRVWSRLGVLRLEKRQRPELVVGVLGCMAQEHRRYLQGRMPHVDLVVGPSAFGDIDRKVEAARQRNRDRGAAALERPDVVRHNGDRAIRGAGIVAVGDGLTGDGLTGDGLSGDGLSGDGVSGEAVSGDAIRRDVRVRPHRSQAYVSVMRGCNMPCAYCIVPATRGREVSRPIEVIVDEAQRLCADGVTEITLLGQTVNAYGRDLGREVTLARLLRALHEIPALRRLAFITSHPNFLNRELIDALAELPKVARYLHLPAQSGSDRVLKAMRRGYTFDRYLARVEQLRERAPDIELHSDWIVGFPGEEDADVDRSVALMERVGFAQSYVFKYSPRPGTRAADELHDAIPEAVKAARNARLLRVQECLTAARNQALVGAVQEVLVEGDSKVAGRLSGRTDQHRIVHFDATDRGLIGRYVPVRIDQALGHSLLGTLLADDAAEVPA